MEVLREVHDAYGVRLEAWTGDPAELVGIRDLVRKALFVTDVEGVSLGPLEDTTVSKIPMMMERGLLAGEGDQDFIVWARSAIEASGYEQGVAVLKHVSDATVGPTEEIAKQIRQAITASKEAGTLQISDDQVNTYVEFLRLTLEAAFQAKRRAGIERYWPVARIAVKTADQAGLERGEYSVGIEGHKVRIDPSMVSFVESVPDHVVEEPFEGGVVFLDTRMTRELIAEGYAKEIVTLVKDARKDMHVAEDRVVEIELVAAKGDRKSTRLNSSHVKISYAVF